MRKTPHPTRRTTTVKTILWALAISIVLCVPASVPARCSLERARVSDVESMLQSGDYAEFKSRYSGLDCLVAFYDSLSVLSPLLGWEPVTVWSSEYTFLRKDALFARDPQPSIAYCSLWMRGLFWIYLAANGKRIRGNEEGRLHCAGNPGETPGAGPVYDLAYPRIGTAFNLGYEALSKAWEIDAGLSRRLDDIYCRAIGESNRLRTFADRLDMHLAANDLVWRIEQATVYNSVMPFSAVSERRYDIHQPK